MMESEKGRIKSRCHLLPIVCFLLLLHLSNQKNTLCVATFSSVTNTQFGTTGGKQVWMYTLTWGQVSADILTFGATLRALRVPDRNNVIDDVVTGFDSLAPYLTKNYRYGCIKGRYGAVIANNSFKIDNTTYKVTSSAANTFCYKIFTAKTIHTRTGVGLNLLYTSPAGEDGMPGKLKVSVTYMLTNSTDPLASGSTVLSLRMNATTDKSTVVNLIHHPYINLAGHRASNLTQAGLANRVKFFADRYLPTTSSNRLPTGTIAPVAGTAYDLQGGAPLLDSVTNLFAKTSEPGFDDYFVFIDGTGMRLAAELRYDPSGRQLQMYTNQPGLIIFTGHKLGNTVGKGGVVYTNFSFQALESAGFRNAPNTPTFPSALLATGKTYEHNIAYLLSTY